MSSKDIFETKLKMYNHLLSIRSRLWTEDGKSRVSVMVGAGFSLNAEKLKDSFESMSVWTDLKNKLSEGFKNEEIAKFDVLELGQKYAEEYGRANLDELLKQAIPDQNYEPSELHEKLLKLPWTDVYTTNYDTLLERTLPNVYERRYQIIYDSSDISSSTSPRLVKLHGSFPSKRPFIFTKNDYNSYAREFAPFVNMVQQSIMETTLVLIGFSGDDPNFEKWMSWVHENLGDHMPKIYMLAYGEQKREDELKKKGITLIDFKDVYEENENIDIYKKMFHDVFDFLAHEKRIEKKEWPYTTYNKYYSSIDYAIEAFEKNRKEYPGWLITPDIIKKRQVNNIQMTCNNVLEMINKETEVFKKIKGMRELIWLYERFHIPIDIYFYKSMQQIIKDSFEDITSINNPKEIGIILLRLIKEARLDFDEFEFDSNIKLLEQLSLSNEQKNSLIFEQVLFKLANYEFKDASVIVNEWEIPKRDIDTLIKKANLLAVIGENSSAIKLFEECLDRVRKLLTIKSSDYHLLSVEGIIIVKLIQLDSNNNFLLKGSRNRLLYLESKLSNPFKELDFLYSRIRPYQRDSGMFIKKAFEPNRLIKTNKFSNIISAELNDSYSMLMISEEYGIQLKGGSSIEGITNIAINNVENLYPFYSWIKYLQIGSIKEIDRFFSREIIFKANSSILSAFFNIVMKGINNRENPNSSLLLEVLSRLYSALIKEEKIKIDELLLNLFVEKDFYKRHGRLVNRIFGPFFRRVIYDKTLQEKAEFFSKILKLPIIGDPGGVLKEINMDEYDFFEPAFEFNFDIQDMDGIYIETDKNEINRLFKVISKNGRSTVRDAALARLIRLIETNNLDNEDSFRLREYVKNIIVKEEVNFSYYFLESYLIRISNDIELLEFYVKQKVEQPIPESYNSGVVLIGNGLNHLLQDLGNTFPKFVKDNSNYQSFIKDEMYKEWLLRFFKWWNSQEKGLLSTNNSNLFDENDDLIKMIIFLKNSFLASIPLSVLSIGDKEKLKEIYNKLLVSKLDSALLLIPALIRIHVLDDVEMKKIAENLITNDRNLSKSAISTVYDLTIMLKQNDIKVDLTELKNELLNLYKYRKEAMILEVTKTLKFICHYAPESLNLDEYLLINKTLNLIMKDFNGGYYQESSISDQEFELLSESTGLAGYIVKNGFFKSYLDLKEWSELSRKSKLPEVRKYASLFE
ncbi:SIR2 family protein [Planomicrobium sp. CPCC 101079]|uniref:SIR2 family NAD-dependent protein deacylase n=1 Tax=Planomicrobium sp. CPCC 101079 TaxID=2599618 RepID=UPI0011B5C738|nr:SIR2 family protein [Planomicrobium sp. CPCC 101079]TWT00126.1 hypothetical protein FQV28_18585 [Planomicrobium sp. CPCC 101079]